MKGPAKDAAPTKAELLAKLKEIRLFEEIRDNDEYMNELRMEVYQVLPLPGNGEGTPSLDVVSVKSGKRDVPFKDPQLAVERTPEGRFLHIRVPLDISPMLTLWTFQLAKQGIVVELEGKI